MIPVKPALSYFRDCYRLDTRTTKLDNFFGRKVEQRYLLDGPEQLLNQELPYLPLTHETGTKLAEVLQLYSKEKAIYYCSMFMVGYGPGATGKRQRFCAPLFMHEAELFTDDDGYAIRIAPDQRMINVDVLSFLRKEEGDLRSYISREVPAEGFSFGQITKLQGMLSGALNNVNAEDLLLYPELASEKTIKNLYSHKDVKDGGFHIVSAAGLALMKRSDSTQGIMTELGQMADIHEGLPSSIMALFGYQPTAVLPDTELGYVPAMLNEAQQKIIDNAHNHHLSVAIGPPGTGKSFTIAAMAIEFMSRGESVLIVSKTDQAVDVIDQKIASDLKITNATVRAGKKDYLRELKSRIENILSGFNRYREWKFLKDTHGHLAQHKVEIEVCESQVKLTRERYDDLLTHESKWGEDLKEANEDPTVISWLKSKYINWLTSTREPHWECAETYLNAQTRRVNLIRKYIEKKFEISIKKTLLHNRKMLRKLLSAVRARTSSRRESIFKELDLEALFGTLPIWLCKLSDLQKALPFKKALFDVVIIDEATQCDIASCLPAIYRAKRVVIVGDPKQLRHVSFLSNSAQHALQRKYGLEEYAGRLDYRDNSILDFVDESLETQSQLTLLDEHYRSLPDLIQFSNEHFYQGSLKIMNVIPENHSASNISHTAVEGTRNTVGVNEEEVNRILDDLKVMIEQEKEFDAELCRTIGILSPFRAQTDYINLRLMEELGIDEINRHAILCGTAHSFQGEERDVMFLSFCLDNEAHATGFRHINRADVFNVSVTRAKSAMHVYTSFELSKLRPEAYLGKYLAAAKRSLPIERKAAVVIHDHFLAEVKALLVERGLVCRVGYEVADLSLDLAVIQGKRLVAIDLIGYPGVFEEGLSLISYKVLHRAGIATFPLPFSFWNLDKERCKKALFDFLSSRGWIGPEVPVD